MVRVPCNGSWVIPCLAHIVSGIDSASRQAGIENGDMSEVALDSSLEQEFWNISWLVAHSHQSLSVLVLLVLASYAHQYQWDHQGEDPETFPPQPALLSPEPNAPPEPQSSPLCGSLSAPGPLCPELQPPLHPHHQQDRWVSYPQISPEIGCPSSYLNRKACVFPIQAAYFC